MRSKLAEKVEGFECRRAWRCIGGEVEMELDTMFFTARMLRLCVRREGTRKTEQG